MPSMMWGINLLAAVAYACSRFQVLPGLIAYSPARSYDLRIGAKETREGAGAQRSWIASIHFSFVCTLLDPILQT